MHGGDGRRSEHIAAVKEEQRKWEEANTDSEAERKAKRAEFGKAKQATGTKDYVSWVDGCAEEMAAADELGNSKEVNRIVKLLANKGGGFDSTQPTRDEHNKFFKDVVP